ncbi:N(4)-(Beta-N-acetylglucosaminyl)-L-asparaginase-like isoform X1 [Mytilus californianus]|uniref:N(4)-(Beta-N-acetylglucosaminyl)-L-asparaginase- like isoform X1 n=1 Tax=Mytilus californianus TaxID=6549 RepID=UPI0022465A25|nr:N(4)-(Beta-N-acetylglucosaminyl)-L-asparaginase-like isoform X1 [Mytilus californianus]
MISVIVTLSLIINVSSQYLPIVINTWFVSNATNAAWEELTVHGGSAVDAVVAGCSQCEASQCRGTVGFGGDPDENGETTLDAMIMDGKTMDVGAVAALRMVKPAIAVARAVMDYTEHTLLVGDQASLFAKDMGFTVETLTTNKSYIDWKNWIDNKCQPNFRQNVIPNPKTSCGPYKPKKRIEQHLSSRMNFGISPNNHDTIGMIAIDKNGNISAGTSTNGLSHKVPGRVGDSPLMGAGSYAMNGAGGAACTGDGDIMMRFLPSFQAVMMMKSGMEPSLALKAAMAPIIQYYPSFFGAMIAVSSNGTFAAVCHGYKTFPFCVASPSFHEVKVLKVQCT